MAELVTHAGGVLLQLNLSHTDIKHYAAGAAVGAELVPALAPILATSAAILGIVDTVGGSDGVTLLAPIGSSMSLMLPTAAGEVVIKVAKEVEGFVKDHPEAIGAAILTGPLGLLTVSVLGLIFGNDDPNYRLESDRERIGPWEKFRLIPQPNNGVALLTYHGGFVCSDEHNVIGNRSEIGRQEVWEIVDLHDGSYAIKAFDKWYLRGDGGKTVAADRTQIGPHEKFKLSFVDGSLCIQAHNGRYLSAQPHKY